jgi:DNA processing protein
VAVLGSGADVIYPPEHADLAASVAAHGALVSEFPPGEPPRSGHFPLRNRIISGLSLAVLVVEAADRSGSLITARAALEQGREVLAVPGSVLSGRNRGCHALIRDGAALVEGAEDVLLAIRASGLRDLVPDARPEHNPGSPSWLAEMAAGESYDVDELAALSGAETARLLSLLLTLELEGAIRRLAGGRFVRVTRTC